MSGTILARFDDGRILLQEVRVVESNYLGSNVPVRVGSIKTVESILSVDTNYDQYGLKVNRNEALISGDKIYVVMRRGDEGAGKALSGNVISGSAALGLLSGITSGLAFNGQLVSGTVISGLITVTANVIGY